MQEKMDNVFHTRSLGAAAAGIKDQYADGIAAKVWEVFIGDRKTRSNNYKDFLIKLLREKGCKRILDVACGTGVDSIMLLEEGFEVVSCDASDKMLKYATEARWQKRKDEHFSDWIITEANWLTINKDIAHLVKDGFDAVICLGNSFAHMLDSYGDQRDQKKSIFNFESCVKKGGLLIIDHRNYDYILRTGRTPTQCMYYNSNRLKDIKTLVLRTDGEPTLVTLDYKIDINGLFSDLDENEKNESQFRLSYHPHTLDKFKNLLKESFVNCEKHTIYGDFKPLDKIEDPGFFIHVLEKKN